MVYATDLNPWLVRAYGFESHPGHQNKDQLRLKRMDSKGIQELYTEKAALYDFSF